MWLHQLIKPQHKLAGDFWQSFSFLSHSSTPSHTYAVCSFLLFSAYRHAGWSSATIMQPRKSPRESQGLWCPVVSCGSTKNATHHKTSCCVRINCFFLLFSSFSFKSLRHQLYTWRYSNLKCTTWWLFTYVHIHVTTTHIKIWATLQIFILTDIIL